MRLPVDGQRDPRTAVAIFDTISKWALNIIMAIRQTMNVSLPPEQERFVRNQVESGRYQSASEVMREGLRMLEQAEHRRLLEKWLYEGLTDDEKKRIPKELFDRAQKQIRDKIEKGMNDARAERTVDGPTVFKRLRKKLRALKP
jgi:antitoxin ParD1/3/4